MISQQRRSIQTRWGPARGQLQPVGSEGLMINVSWSRDYATEQLFWDTNTDTSRCSKNKNPLLVVQREKEKMVQLEIKTVFIENSIVQNFTGDQKADLRLPFRERGSAGARDKLTESRKHSQTSA